MALAVTAFAQDKKIIYTSRGEKFEGINMRQKNGLTTLFIEGGEVKIPTSIITKITDNVEYARLQLIVMDDDETASEAYKELNLGVDFTDLVKKYSRDPATWFADGKTDFVDRSYLSGIVAATAFIFPEGRHTGPVKGDNGMYYIVKVLEKKYMEKETPKPKEVPPTHPRPGTSPPRPPETPPAGTSLTDQGPQGQGTAPQTDIIKVAILPITELTREASEEGKGFVAQDILVSEISSASGLEAFTIDQKSSIVDVAAGLFFVEGEVRLIGTASAVKLILKDKGGKTLYDTGRLTAVGDKQFFEAVKTLAHRLAREIRKSAESARD